MVLYGASFYLRALLDTQLKETGLRVFEIPGVNGSILEMVVEYCYKHEIDINRDNVDAILIAASFLQMPELEATCIQFYKQIMKPSNCLGIWEIAEQYALQDLKHFSREFTVRHFGKVADCQEFAYIRSNRLGNLLRMDDLKINGEEEVFRVLMRWIDFDTEQRKASFQTLIEHVRIQHVRESVS